MIYEFKDLFIKKCEGNNGQGFCTKSHNATKCIDDVCVDINPQNNKLDLLKGAGELKLYKCKKCDYQTNNPVHFIKHTKKYHYMLKLFNCSKKKCSNTLNAGRVSGQGIIKLKGKGEDPELEQIRLENLEKKYPEAIERNKNLRKKRREKKLEKQKLEKQNVKKVEKSIIPKQKFEIPNMILNLFSKQKGSGKEESSYKCDYPGCEYASNRSHNLKVHKLNHKKRKAIEGLLKLHNPQQGSGKLQYRGRKSSVMVKVPETVKKTALYSFKLKKLGFEGGRETGWKRAKQLATKEYIPIEDLRYMRAWFARHVYTSYPTFLEWKKAGRQKDSKWHKVHGIIAILIWGGEAALKWVNSQKNLNLLNKHFNKNYKKIKIPK